MKQKSIVHHFLKMLEILIFFPTSAKVFDEKFKGIIVNIEALWVTWPQLLGNWQWKQTLLWIVCLLNSIKLFKLIKKHKNYDCTKLLPLKRSVIATAERSCDCTCRIQEAPYQTHPPCRTAPELWPWWTSQYSTRSWNSSWKTRSLNFITKIYKHPTAKPVNQEPNSERAEWTETYLNKEGCKTRIIGAWINGNCSYFVCTKERLWLKHAFSWLVAGVTGIRCTSHRSPAGLLFTCKWVYGSLRSISSDCHSADSHIRKSWTCAAAVKREVYLPASSSDLCFDMLTNLKFGTPKCTIMYYRREVSCLTSLLLLCRNVYLSIPVSFLNSSSNFNILVREMM